MTKQYTVTFLPDEVRASIPEGTTLLQAAVEAGMNLEGPCGGKGTCGKCKVYLIEGETPKTVLACKTIVEKDMIVNLPRNDSVLFRKGEDDYAELGVKIDSGISKKAYQVKEPELETQYADLTRLYEAIGKEIPITYTALKTLPNILREGNHEITVTATNNLVLAIQPGNTEDLSYGLAIDIGTTTVVVSLINLNSGVVLYTASATNTQNIFGADVIARIDHVSSHPQGLQHLQERILSVINNLIHEISLKTNISSQNIYKVVVVGNTTMEHMFLGVDPRYLGPAPFIPAITHSVDLEAQEIGVQVNPCGRVHLFPNIAGYVGGDTTSVILATEIYKNKGNYLAVDIGTNGEIVLSIDGKMFACSTAAGPAFEGAQIKCGMRAAPGAIEGVDLKPDISLKVIGDVWPTGICGSGLIQAIRVMVTIGVLEPSGRMISREEGAEREIALDILDRLGKDENGSYFILSVKKDQQEAVIITQKDIRGLQLAKGAIRTGIEILIKEAGIKVSDIDQVLLAGAFGNYIDQQSALSLGLLPNIPKERIKTVGNAAGTGAKMALISNPLLKDAESISRKVTHIELSGRTDFYELFIEYLSLDSKE